MRKHGGVRRALGLGGWIVVMACMGACGDEYTEEVDDGRCNGSGNGPCNADPWNCPAGQTCSFEGMGFACLNVGSGAEGDACMAVAGGATCGQDMLCVQLVGGGGGNCRRYCSATDACKACPTGFNCTPIGSDSGNVQVCMPP
jgi:hypothetical protein